MWLSVIAAASLLAPAASSAPSEPARIHSDRQANQRRQAVVQYVYGQPRLPTARPTVTPGVTNHRLDTWQNLRSIDRLTHRMGRFTSHAYLLHPRRANGRLMVFHAGHGQGWQHPFYNPAPRFFLARGYTVLALSMPLYGYNRQPARFKTHDDMNTLHRPLRYFVEPVTVDLNWTLRRRDWRSVSMTGLSGGGWTTMLAAAVDTRIQSSYPVAGALPMYLRIPIERADLEQHDTGLLRRADYTELYALAAQDRRVLQFYNVHDPCCFGGTRGLKPAPVVRGMLRGTGGRFGVVLDWRNREHSYTPMMLERIDGDVNGTG